MGHSTLPISLYTALNLNFNDTKLYCCYYNNLSIYLGSWDAINLQRYFQLSICVRILYTRHRTLREIAADVVHWFYLIYSSQQGGPIMHEYARRTCFTRSRFTNSVAPFRSILQYYKCRL